MCAEIKICGIRRAVDVEYINAYGPDYAGIVLWDKSFRYVTAGQGAELRKRMDERIPMVGVFVDERPERIAAYVEAGMIQIVQLHGHETEEEIERIKKMTGVSVWKAFKVRTRGDLHRALECRADRILLDNGYGTGGCFDHSLLTDYPGDYILAGGLTPENIPDVIAKFRPAAIDISSGVETDGYKDEEKIRRAVSAVRGRYNR